VSRAPSEARAEAERINRQGLVARLLVVCAVAVIAGAGCSSKTPGASSSGSGHPSTAPSASATPTVTASATPFRDLCALVPSSTVAAAFGGTITGTESTDFLNNPTCNYGVNRSNLGLNGRVQVIDLIFDDATWYAGWVAGKRGPHTVQVPGIADEAWYDPDQTSVLLHHGNNVYFVGAIFSPPTGTVLDPAKVKTDTVALAKVVGGLI